jgi:opacity protein-like surface antigen
MRLTAFIASLSLAATLAAHAADTPEPPPGGDPLASARNLIKASQWNAALQDLRKVNATGNADWNNLMGYSLRKQTPPDLAASQRYYDAALRINPQHTGALEYSGELALMKGDLATAEARAAALAKACPAPCAGLDDLRKSIASFKAGTHKPY